MSEIPMPTSDPYQPRKESSNGCGSCAKIGVVICVLFIVGMLIIAMVFWGGIASIFGGIFGGGGGGTSYDTRTISSTNRDITIYGTEGYYYYGEFDVYSSEVQTSTPPDVFFDISIVHTGTDSVTVTIHYAIYETDSATVVGAATWSELNVYLMDDGDSSNSVNTYINLNNYADTYTWVLWYEASSKTDTWSVDIDLTLRYNWNL